MTYLNVNIRTVFHNNYFYVRSSL